MNKKDLKSFKKIIDSLPKYVIKIGVPVDTKSRKEKSKSGITNAELMYFHENGTARIPKRPILKFTIAYGKKELSDKAIKNAILAYVKTGKIESLENELEKMCVRMENWAKKEIRQGDLLSSFAPLSPKTIAQKNKRYGGKGASQPLLDTGQLSRSIKCILEKK